MLKRKYNRINWNSTELDLLNDYYNINKKPINNEHIAMLNNSLGCNAANLHLSLQIRFPLLSKVFIYFKMYHIFNFFQDTIF